MTMRKTELTATRDALLKEDLTPSRVTPTGAIRAVAKSLDILASGPGSHLIPWLAAHALGPSIAPKILASATGGTANCSVGRSCAKTYLALQGMAVPIGATTVGLNLTRLEWWLQAMAEHATDRWRGSAQGGVKVIAAARLEIWEQTHALPRFGRRVRAPSRTEARAFRRRTRIRFLATALPSLGGTANAQD